MKTNHINTEMMNRNITLDFHKREVDKKDIKKETKTSNDNSSKKLGAANKGPVSDPLMNPMMFQVCGSFQATLTGLQNVIFKNQQELMETGTEQAASNILLQGTEAKGAFSAGVEAGRKQKDQLILTATQNFITGAMSIGSAVGQQVASSKSSAGKSLTKLQSKLAQQQKLAEMSAPDSKTPTLGGAQVNGGVANPTTTQPVLSERAKALLAHGGAEPTANGQYCDETLDQEAITSMGDKKADFHKSCQDQIRATKTEISTARQEVTEYQGLIQSATQFGQQFTTAGVNLAQAPLGYDQKVKEAVATMYNQSANTTAQIAQQSAKMRESAVDEGKNAVAALVQAMNVRG
jgi:hypothetical protein